MDFKTPFKTLKKKSELVPPKLHRRPHRHQLPSGDSSPLNTLSVNQQPEVTSPSKILALSINKLEINEKENKTTKKKLVKSRLTKKEEKEEGVVPGLFEDHPSIATSSKPKRTYTRRKVTETPKEPLPTRSTRKSTRNLNRI